MIGGVVVSDFLKGAQPGDRVRVTPHPYEGTMVCDGSQGRLIQIRDDEGMLHAFGPNHGAVELIEPADDPSKDDAGTLRREDHEETNGFSLWQATQDRNGQWRWLCVYSTADGNRGLWLDHDHMADLPVVGATPWTPAWEAERAEVEHTNECPPEPEDLDLPMSVRQLIADLLMAGDRAGAVRVMRKAVDIGFNDARRYLETWSEYQTGLNQRPVETVELPEVDNEAIALGLDLAERARARQQREPRVFTSDGPEPPQDVTCLEWLDYDPNDFVYAYLRREGSGWAWVSGPEGPTHAAIQFWPPIAANAWFREVQP